MQELGSKGFSHEWSWSPDVSVGPSREQIFLSLMEEWRKVEQHKRHRIPTAPCKSSYADENEALLLEIAKLRMLHKKKPQLIHGAET